MSKPTDTQMLDWVAQYVTEINSLVHNGKGEKIEVVWACDTKVEYQAGGVITRTGKTYRAAFRKCIAHGLKIVT